jgi:hypothetical protein
MSLLKFRSCSEIFFRATSEIKQTLWEKANFAPKKISEQTSERKQNLWEKAKAASKKNSKQLLRERKIEAALWEKANFMGKSKLCSEKNFGANF